VVNWLAVAGWGGPKDPHQKENAPENAKVPSDVYDMQSIINRVSSQIPLITLHAVFTLPG